MVNRKPFGVDEWYHCYTRGVDKRKTFLSVADYKRFLQIIYLSNSDTHIRRSDLLRIDHTAVFEKKRGKPLVAIGAYCLMPNHFHILLQEIRDRGISQFMQRVGIAYSMYFNIKNNRTGNLFVRPFRSKHIEDDAYLRQVAQYIHLNPIELFDAEWKSGKSENLSQIEKYLSTYPYSSLQDYWGKERPERASLDTGAYSLISDGLPALSKTLLDVAEYYRSSL